MDYSTVNLKIRLEIIKILQFIFGNNYFIYANQYFQQLDGIAMGTNVAPVIANLYLALKFDSKIKSLANIKYFRRYIDDCFILYKGDLKQFINFEFTILQKTIAPIKLTYEFNMSSINFLDLTIFKDNGSNSFATKIYQKALNKYNYIPMFSNHPKSNIRGFIIGELNRYTLSSSFKNDCSLVFDLFFNRLKMRGKSNLKFYL